MPKKVLVVYYTQTGQLRDIVNSFTVPLIHDGGVTVVFEELKPKPAFPFPWTSDSFFQAMPESVAGIPCELEPMSLTSNEDFDLIVIAWQPWFLSPSIPIHAFFQLETAKKLLTGKPVLTIIGSRNMWIMAQEDVRDYILENNARLVGKIILYDKAPNLLSVVSIIRWMFSGKKERFMKIFPPAGIANEDIKGVSGFGNVVLDALKKNDYTLLNTALVSAGAVDVLPSLLMIEKRGKLFFRIWAAFILRKGSYGDPRRVFRVRMFKYYLLTVLYLVSPFASLLFIVIKPFRGRAMKKQISLYQSC